MRLILMAGLASLVMVMPMCAGEPGTPGEVAKSGNRSAIPQAAPYQWWQSVTEPVKDLAQIFFWVTVSIVTILTYRRARKTLLQPIRTEVFKLQIEEIKQLFDIVIGKDETELRNYFGFDELITVNATALLDDYALLRLGMKIDDVKRPYLAITDKIINTEGPGVSIYSVDSPRIPAELLAALPNDRTPAQQWDEYRFAVIHLTPTYVGQSKRLEQFLGSPMLPVECVELVRSLRDTMKKNVLAIFRVLTEAAKDLPKHVTTEKDMMRVSAMWITSRYAGAFQPLKADADKIVTFIRSHFGVDQLLNDA